MELAHGRKLDEIVNSMKMVAEGIKTTNAAVDLARRHSVEMPISEQMFQMLHFGITPRGGDPAPDGAVAKRGVSANGQKIAKFPRESATSDGRTG